MSGGSRKMMLFWQELRRRNILHTLTLYVAFSFGLIELIDIISGPLSLPGWTLKAAILLAIAGIPFMLVLSWVFRFTLEGIRRYSIDDEQLAIEDASKDHPGESVDDLDHLITEEDLNKQKGVSQPAFAGRQERAIGRRYGITSLIIISVVVVFFLFYGAKSVQFNERDWIILGDFINHTREEVLDHSLNTAFEIGINQSRYVNVIQRRRIKEALHRIGVESDTVITEELCREIALREGAKAYIVPEVSRVGDQYIITGRLFDAENGSEVVSEVFVSKNQHKIVTTLDRLCKRLRRHLGESRYQVTSQHKPLAKVTTSSLDALKQFSLAIEYHMNMDFNNARIYYENAIRLDNDFTAAKASLGNILYEQFDRKEGKRWLDEAIQSIDDLTEREKIGILAFYAANVEGDIQKSISITRTGLELYPDDIALRNNLGWYLQNLGQYEEAIVHYKAAIKIDPYTLIPYGGMIWTYLSYLGQLDSALYWSTQMINSAPDNGWGYCYKGSAFFGLGDIDRALEYFEKGREIDPGLAINLYRLAHTYRVMGQYEKELEALKAIQNAYPEDAEVYYDLGICYPLMQENEQAVQQFQKYNAFVDAWQTEYPDNPATYLSKGLVMTRLGDVEGGMEAGAKMFELDSTLHFEYATLLAVAGYKEQAIDQLEIALEKGYRDICWIRMMPDLMSLQDNQRYLRIMNHYFQPGDAGT